MQTVLLFMYLSQAGAYQYQDFTGHLVSLLILKGTGIVRQVLNEDSAKGDEFCRMSEDLYGQVILRLRSGQGNVQGHHSHHGQGTD